MVWILTATILDENATGEQMRLTQAAASLYLCHLRQTRRAQARTVARFAYYPLDSEHEEELFCCRLEQARHV